MKLINFKVGIDQPLFLIAGPCVIESEEMTLRVAEELKNVCIKLGVPFIFKSSFDKANRSSNSTFRGFGMEEGLRILEKVKAQFDLPVLTDIHTTDQVKPVSEIVDVLLRARDAIEALDGTSVENERLVDDYRAVVTKATGV